MRSRKQLPEIIIAAENGDVQRIESLLTAYPEMISITSRKGDAAIHAAAAQNQASAVRFLLDHGADVNIKGHWNRTPLHDAVHAAAVEVVQLLLQRGASTDAVDDRGQTPLQLAAAVLSPSQPESKQILDLLKGSGSEYDLASAVKANDLPGVQVLLKADPGAIAKAPKEPGLVVAAILRDASLEFIQLLLEHGADPNAPLSRTYREYPLTIVSDPAMAELLLQHGAKINLKNWQGLTALQKARKFKEKELEQVLRRHEVKPAKKGKPLAHKNKQSPKSSKPAGTARKEAKKKSMGKKNLRDAFRLASLSFLLNCSLFRIRLQHAAPTARHFGERRGVGGF